MKEPEDYGHWDGDVFVFDSEVPIIMSDTKRPRIVKRLDFSEVKLPPDVTRDDVVHAMLNPVQGQELP